MVKLRLARFGKKKQPKYRIIATNLRSKRNGEALEYLGIYDPLQNPSLIELNTERVKYWIENGAQPTYTVKSLLVISGFMKADIKKRPAKEKVKEESKKSKESK